MKNLSILDPASRASFCFVHCGKKTLCLSLVPRPVRAIRVTRGGLEQSAIARIFPTSLTGDVTSEIAEDDWERGWLCLAFEVADAQTSALVNSVHFLINEPSLPSVGLLGLGSKSVSQEKKKHSQLPRFSQTCEL